MAVSPRGRPPSERDTLMLRHLHGRRTLVAAALIGLLLVPAAATASAPERREGAVARPLDAVEDLWQSIRELLGLAGDAEEGASGDVGGVATRSTVGGGATGRGSVVEPNGLGEQPNASSDSEGDEGPHMDPNG